MDISVVIPSYNDAAGLYFTVASSIVDLETTPYSWEVIAVVDREWHDTARDLKHHDGCKMIYGDFGSPQHSRHAGAAIAQGKHLFFLDSHVVPCHGFFKSMVEAAEKTGGAIIFSPHTCWTRGTIGYGYGIAWRTTFWAKDHQVEPTSNEPYRVALMGMGGILVNREKYFRMGGYWLEQKGWGGEETHLPLKAWMLGESCWVDPRSYHWHYMKCRRKENVFQSPSFIRNHMLCAYAIGGQEYLDGIYTYYSLMANQCRSVEAARMMTPTDPYREMYEGVPKEAAIERAIICSGPWGGDLNKLRAFFNQNNIHN